MFTIETKRFGMKVRFVHTMPGIPFMKPGTACDIEIYNKNTKRRITGDSGHTFLHKDDQYSRPFGRKLALARAIQSLIPRRFVGVRRMIWREYFKTISPKRGA